LRTLAEWLAFIERQHPKAIALGLDRVAAVLERMQIALAVPVITVGGTNGKGSCCALLEAMLRAGGYRTGLYTSPHLVPLRPSACASPAPKPRMTRWAPRSSGGSGAWPHYSESAAHVLRIRHASGRSGCLLARVSMPPSWRWAWAAASTR